MQSKAATVQEYLASLPADRRAALEAVRRVILKNLDKDYEEGMQYGAIGYYVPHRVYPAGYHCDPRLPLPFAGLGWQKHHMSLGLMSNYPSGPEDKWFRAAWAKSGKKLDMGKCCIRFKKIEDVPLDVIGEAIRRVPAAKMIAHYEAAILSRNKKASNAAKARPSRAAATKATAKGRAGGDAARPARRKAAASVRS